MALRSASDMDLKRFLEPLSFLFEIHATLHLRNFQTTRVFIEDMIERHSGYVVGIASMIAFYPLSTAVSYTTSKFAVKGFMDALIRESLHENWGVKTLTVFPHLTNTCKEVMDNVRRMVPYVCFVFVFCFFK